MRHFKTDIADVIFSSPMFIKMKVVFESFIESYFNDIVGEKLILFKKINLTLIKMF